MKFSWTEIFLLIYWSFMAGLFVSGILDQKQVDLLSTETSQQKAYYQQCTYDRAVLEHSLERKCE